MEPTRIDYTHYSFAYTRRVCVCVLRAAIKYLYVGPKQTQRSENEPRRVQRRNRSDFRYRDSIFKGNVPMRMQFLKKILKQKNVRN